MKKLLIGLLFLAACSENKCPCGEVPYGLTDGSCAWEFFHVDKRPQCEGYDKPAPCPWPETNGTCKPPARKYK